MSGLREWLTRVRDLNLTFESLKALVPFFIILLLVIWLLYRIKIRIKKAVQDEIYKSFPSIRDTIENFEKRIKLLSVEAERLEKKLNELKNR